MKKTGFLVLTAAISVLAGFTAMAGEWQQDSIGWRYDNGDATYKNNEWSWINDRCYYFDGAGYCLTNTTTPDGYQVNGDGAWVVYGVVQTEHNTEVSSELQFKRPEGFRLIERTSEMARYEKDGIHISVTDVNYVERIKEKHPDEDNVIMDLDVVIGSHTSKTVCQLNSGEWTRYVIDNNDPFSSYASTTIKYSRLIGEQWQTVSFTGKTIMDFDTEAVMNECIKGAAESDTAGDNPTE